MLQVLQPYRVAFERLAISFLFIFIIADLYPHPSLAPGLIMSTVSYIQSTNITELDTSKVP